MSESTSDADELPIDREQVPDRWDIMHDPTNADPEAVTLDYRVEGHADPVAAIILQTADTPRGPDEGYAVEVQDKNADGDAMNYLNPLAEWEPHERHDQAVQHLHELAEEYPLPETRE
jgi:hypothetical protein